MQSNESPQKAYIFDIDGTLAIRGDTRGPHEFRRCIEDRPNTSVINVLQALTPKFNIILLSGREECHRQMTEWWLRMFEIPYRELHMRRTHDSRPDHIVKWEIYETKIRPFFAVLGVFDDRDSVVKMWRAHGIVCFQVAEGDF